MQCYGRWYYLKAQGKISIDEAVYMSTWYTPNLSYNYNDDVQKAYSNQRKKILRKSTVWSPKMV